MYAVYTLAEIALQKHDTTIILIVLIILCNYVTRKCNGQSQMWFRVRVVSLTCFVAFFLFSLPLSFSLSLCLSFSTLSNALCPPTSTCLRESTHRFLFPTSSKSFKSAKIRLERSTETLVSSLLSSELHQASVSISRFVSRVFHFFFFLFFRYPLNSIHSFQTYIHKTMTQESIYNLIAPVQQKAVKGARYTSKYNPTIPPTGSTFGLGTKSASGISNVGGDFSLSSKHIKPGATMGTPRTQQNGFLRKTARDLPQRRFHFRFLSCGGCCVAFFCSRTTLEGGREREGEIKRKRGWECVLNRDRDNRMGHSRGSGERL